MNGVDVVKRLDVTEKAETNLSSPKWWMPAHRKVRPIVRRKKTMNACSLVRLLVPGFEGNMNARALRPWECGASGRWHIHCAIELPSHFDAITLENLIRECWAKVE